MSLNAVRRYTSELEERVVSTEKAAVVTKDGVKSNRNLLYTIRPTQLTLDQFDERQLT